MSKLSFSHQYIQKMIPKYAILGIFLVSLLSIVDLAHAIAVTSPTSNLPNVNSTDPNAPGDMIARIIAYGIGLAGVLAIMAITWGAILIISGAGDEEKMKQGRKIIIFALIGVLIAGGAYLLVNLVSNIRVTS